MKLENIVKAGIFSALVAASGNVNAQEVKAEEATSQEILGIYQKNDNATNASKDQQKDWSQQKILIDGGYATVLTQAAKDKPGYCVFALDGFPQRYELPADKRTHDGILEKSEWILNLSESDPENIFYFPCDRKVEASKPIAPTPIAPAPKPVQEPAKKESPSLRVSPGVSYLHIVGNDDKIYDFDGALHGASLSLALQPSFTNWYFGGQFSAYGNASSRSVDMEVPATEGPLAGQLVMRGKNDYSSEHFGMGIGSIFGYMIPIGKKGKWEENVEIGLELEHGIMHDWTTREFTESSAHYINDNLLEGTNISNHADDTDTQFYGYLMPGMRIKFPFVCGTFSGGFRTDLSEVNSMFSAGVAYCPNKE